MKCPKHNKTVCHSQSFGWLTTNSSPENDFYLFEKRFLCTYFFFGLDVSCGFQILRHKTQKRLRIKNNQIRIYLYMHSTMTHLQGVQHYNPVVVKREGSYEGNISYVYPIWCNTYVFLINKKKSFCFVIW